MNEPQPGILAPIPSHARYLEFSVVDGGNPASALRHLASMAIGMDTVVGLGATLVQGLGHSIAGLRPFPHIAGPVIEGGSCDIPSTQTDLWFWVRDSDRGRVIHSARSIMHMLEPAFQCDRIVDGFKYETGLDLTGYEDGTENPVEDAAYRAAVVAGAGPDLDGSSFVAVQQWAHNLDQFEAMTQDERDNVIGRRLSDNEELDDAPESAHVKRTAQESFDPEAFVVRRSMPWADSSGEGLMFVAFGHSFDAFEAQISRMAGHDDAITDGVFSFSHPISGAYFWCPAVSDGKLNLVGVGL